MTTLRRFFAALGFACFATCVVRATHGAERVAVGVHTGSQGLSPALSEFKTSLESELKTAGFATVSVSGSTGLADADLESAAANSRGGAAVAIEQADGQVTARVWVRDRRSGQGIARRIPPEPTSGTTPHLFALRTTELVRAALLEAQGIKPPASSTAPMSDEKTAAAEPPSEASETLKPLALFVAASVLLNRGSLPTAFAPSASFAYRPHRRWAFGAAFTGPGMADVQLGGGAGWRGGTSGGGPTMAYEQEFLLAQVSYGVMESRTSLSPFMIAGLGAYRLGARVTGQGGGSTSDQIWAPLASLGGGARLHLSRNLALRAEAHLAMAIAPGDLSVAAPSANPASPLASISFGVELRL